MDGQVQILQAALVQTAHHTKRKNLAPSSNWLGHSPLKAEMLGSNPAGVIAGRIMYHRLMNCWFKFRDC